MKRIALLVVFIVFSANLSLFAGEETDKEAESVQIPLRFICENQGAELTWDSKSKAVTVKNDGSTIYFTIGSKNVNINGKQVTLDREIQPVNGRVKMPLSLLNEGMGANLTPDDCIKILAVKYVDLLKQNAASDCRFMCSDYLSQALTPELVKRIGEGLGSYGKMAKVDVTINGNGVHRNAVVRYYSDVAGLLDCIVRFDLKGCIDDFMLSASDTGTYMTPDYDKAENYTEKEVVIGEGEWRLPGVLTIPRGEGPFPAVVLIHGSGPNDKDETLGPLKPFRDLAVGLASNNVAVLRYNKRTYEHNIKFGADEKVTVREETVDDAISAVNFLSKVPGIDPSRIFVIGHSQGGMLMPRIINADTGGGIKGAVIMSGNTRPLWDLMDEQYKYLVGLNIATEEQREFYKSQFDILKAPEFSPDNPPKGFTLGAPYWWADLKSYDPAETVKGIVKPLLILQGARDYQVSAGKDFQDWKDALAGKDNVSFKLYPKLNHMYTEGEGDMSTPLEYNKQANIPQYVIDDIAKWVNKVSEQ